MLQGAYIKPEFSFGVYSENRLDSKTNNPVVSKVTTVVSSLMIDLEKQWFFSEAMVLDFYVGLGYAVDNIKDYDRYSNFNNSDAAYHFTFTRLGSNPGFALRSGLRLGILLDNKKPK